MIDREPARSEASPDIVGVLLAGGASRRMGAAKALLELPVPVDGEAPPWGRRSLTLGAWALERLEGSCAEVLIAAGSRGEIEQQLLADAARLDISASPVADGAGQGPAAAILGAAAARPKTALLVLACDLPLVPQRLLARLGEVSARADLTIPRLTGRSGDTFEPLAARWGPHALSALERHVAAGRSGLQALIRTEGFVRTLRTHFLEETELRLFGEPRTMFLNCNHPHDLRALLTSAQRHGS